MKVNKEQTIYGIKNKINSKIFCFGAGSIGVDFCDFAIYSGIKKENLIFVDNFTFNTEKHGISVISKGDMIQKVTENDTIVITTLFCGEIYEDLQTISELDNIEVNFAQLLYSKDRQETKELILTKKSDVLIPKTIHYCWFGNSQIPDDLKRYMATWEEKCPDYTIKRWDESNYDITKNRYMREAYEAKKWGFVPDYARLDILYNSGGIYLDTDVEILKPFDDLLNQGAFFSFTTNFKINIGSGIASTPKHRLVKEMLDEYSNISFHNPDGSLNITPCMEYQHRALIKYNYKTNGKLQEFEDFTILPIDILCGYDHYFDTMLINKNTFSVHHSKHSWQGEERMKNIKKSTKLLQGFL